MKRNTKLTIVALILGYVIVGCTQRGVTLGDLLAAEDMEEFKMYAIPHHGPSVPERLNIVAGTWNLPSGPHSSVFGIVAAGRDD